MKSKERPTTKGGEREQERVNFFHSLFRRFQDWRRDDGGRDWHSWWNSCFRSVNQNQSFVLWIND